RAAFLTEACGPDAALRAEVEALLAAHADPASILEPPPPAPPDATGAFKPDATLPADGATREHVPNSATGTFGDAPRALPVTAPATGTVIAGRYALVEVIGEGGMGSVYLAGQVEPVKRQVALKLIRTGMDSRGVLARFEAERQALAIMDHPNI